MATVRKNPNRDDQYEVRWLDPESGKRRSRLFELKRDAKRFANKVGRSVDDGSYVDPDAGKLTFKCYAEEWRSRQVHRPSTAEQIESHLRLHVYPTIGARPLGSLRISDLQSLVKALDAQLAPSTVEVVFAWVASILKSAAADRLPVPSTADVRLPSVTRSPIVPLEPEVVAGLAEQIPERYRAAIVLGAGSGMRISEMLGLTVDRVDFLNRRITVDRQLTRQGGRLPVFGPVKDRDNRLRTIPVGQIVVDALAEHLARYGPGPEGLIFTTRFRGPVRSSTWSENWRTAAKGLDVAGGVHALRHFYASTLISAGCTVKEVQERLGHRSASMTLDVYSHLWPSDEERTRTVTDSALGKIFRGKIDDHVTTESTIDDNAPGQSAS
jgi:integrase